MLFFVSDIVNAIYYSCGNRHCPNYKEGIKGVDWGIYPSNPSANNDLSFFQEKCSNDVNCGGIKCYNMLDSVFGGHIQGFACYWWRKGKCIHESELRSIESKAVSCIKLGGGKIFLSQQ